MRKLVALVVLAGAVLVSASASAAQARGPNPRAQRILGMVPANPHAAAAVSGSGQLTYHGGPVMLTNKTYAIFWIPSGYSVSSLYVSLLNRFLTDVAAASGQTSNVYWSDTQYYQGSNPRQYISYSSTFGGSYTDTDPFPASACSDGVTQTTVCLSDAQLQSEVSKIKSRLGWVSNPSTVFFLFTPRNVGSCTGSYCAFRDYCAYHSWYGSGSTVTLYANQPYTMTVPSSCDSGQHPNGSEADPTINVVSHEHNEAITDEQGNAWYDLAGYENGDKCAWDFGSALGSTQYGLYNQLINGHTYYTQREYSDATSRCVLTGT
jgi:hypothetical protein